MGRLSPPPSYRNITSVWNLRCWQQMNYTARNCRIHDEFKSIWKEAVRAFPGIWIKRDN
jgi:hypothetical protein